jgi:hypothetical protein
MRRESAHQQRSGKSTRWTACVADPIENGATGIAPTQLFYAMCAKAHRVFAR